MAAPTTTTLAAPPTTAATTKPWAPSAPEPTSSQAAYALIGAWGDDNRAQARQDASPGAVASLFANSYPDGGPEFRGCSTPPANTAAACVWRSGNDLLSLTVEPFPNGWGVIAAIMET